MRAFFSLVVGISYLVRVELDSPSIPSYFVATKPPLYKTNQSAISTNSQRNCHRSSHACGPLRVAAPSDSTESTRAS